MHRAVQAKPAQAVPGASRGRHARWELKIEALPFRHELLALREEMRALRQDMHQRFEATDRCFEAMWQDMHQRLEVVITDLQNQKRQLRETNLPRSALGQSGGVRAGV